MTESSSVDLQVEIDGLPVPAALVRVVREGRWGPPADDSRFVAVFGEPAVQPVFLPLDRMGANARWIDQLVDDEVRAWYVCWPASEWPPGDIDPVRSLLVGDLGPEMPFALDYRRSTASPSVVYLTGRGWREVARDVETLVEKLGL
jgi:hypothetical protein